MHFKMTTPSLLSSPTHNVSRLEMPEARTDDTDSQTTVIEGTGGEDPPLILSIRLFVKIFLVVSACN